MPELVAAELERSGSWDGLPLATGRIDAFRPAITASGLRPEEPLGPVPPTLRPVTLATLASLAGLAGCAPEHLPVLVAAVRALGRPEFNGVGVATTTGSAACLLVVTGPAAAQGGFGGGANCLGPSTRANAAVGRALGLVLRHVGGAVPGRGDMATMGQPGKYTFCFTENADASPWEPLHADHGLAPDASAVTLFAAAGTVEVVDPYARSAEEVLDTLARVLVAPRAVSTDTEPPLVGSGRALVLVTPEWAELLRAARLGKREVKAQLRRRATLPLAEVPATLRPVLAATDPAPAFAADEDIELAVAGGVGIKQTVIPGWNHSSQPVTVAL